MKMLSLFSGIGAFEQALKNSQVDFDLVGFSEIDKYAVKSYCAIHNIDESKNLGDITKIKTDKLGKGIDLITYGFPCQDISISGKMLGLFNDDGTKTRSGLFFDALRIIEYCQPKVAIAENVKNLTSKKFDKQFRLVLSSLDAAGYNNYWAVLNAKDYGVPQNRERVFIVSIREDVDNGLFRFPEPCELKLNLRDVLEEQVDEKFYLSEQMLKYAFNIEKEAKGIGFSDGVNRSYINPDIAQTIGCRSAAHQRSGTTNYVSDSKEKIRVSDWKQCIQAVNLNHYKNDQMNRIYSTEGISPAIFTKTGGGRETKILIKNETTAHHESTAWISEKGVKYILSPKRGMCTDINPNVIQPLTAKGQSNWTGSFVSPDIDKLEKGTTIGSDTPVKIILKNGETITSTDDTSWLRIRKLTPKECFRLMGFGDEAFYKASAVNSNTQLYKQAGNSIVVDVLEHLLRSLMDCVAIG